MNTLLATFITIAIVSQQVHGEHNNYGSQVIAQFPKGVWNSDCKPENLRRLPEKCFDQINSNSSMAEKLACALLQAPGTERMVPIGLFPADVPLGTDILRLSSDALTPFFEECALERMIDDGCITFTRNVWGGEHSSDTYTTSSEYSSMVGESFGIDASVSAGFGPVSITSSINKQNERASSTHNMRSVSGFSQVWRNSVGTISFGKCVDAYISPKIPNEWQDIVEKSKSTSVFDLALDKEFAQVSKKGFYYPVTYGFAVQYRGDIIATYDSAEESSSSSMAEAISVGVEASFFGATAGASTTVSEAVAKSSSGKSVNAKVSNFVSTNGECDFPKMLENGAADWSNLLSKCAQTTADNIENLPRASHIPRGGFASLTTYLAEQGIDINTPKINAALKIYNGYCRWTDGAPQYKKSDNKLSVSYSCYLADGSFAYKETDTMVWDIARSATPSRLAFIQPTWPLIQDAGYFDESHRTEMLKKHCPLGCSPQVNNLRG